ncbi:hypothetical protein [Paenibacillus periandrae]|uniref:hypothetical protein n=1 Tax=Paenibacillus periandrae TaxID=1761741 RepID=UPI001F0907C9|nr:hypothetical protein [Paenibacillus periandrae]
MISIVMFVVGIGGFTIIYLAGQDLLPKTYVYEPKKGAKVEKFSEITADKFELLFDEKEILQAAITPTMITPQNKNQVINKTMVQTLHPGDFLTVNYVGDTIFAPKKGEKEYPIPASWWEVLDWTGRNGDTGDIWLFPSEKLKQSQAAKANTQSKLLGLPEVVEQVKDTPERPLTKPVFENVRLRYIMDSTNKTVKNQKGVDDRSEGTAKPTEAKIYLKSDEYAVLKMAVQEGYKLIYAVNGE